MSVKVEVSEGGVPHDRIMAIGLVGSLVAIYLTYLNALTGTQLFSFFGGIGAILAIWWGTDSIKNLCSYGIGTGVPSAGMISLGSGVIAMLLATKLGVAAPIGAIIIAAVLGVIIGFLSDKVLNMNIPVMIRMLTELTIIGALILMGFSAMATGSFEFINMITGTTTFFGLEVATYSASLIGGSVIAVIFMLGGIAIQHPFNACLGPNESQDRTQMCAAECGFLSMIAVAVMSFAFLSVGAAILGLIVAFIGWIYTYVEYIKLSKRDAYDWLDAKPIREPKGGA
jgi:tetrahydromethanopterin S-methyltransferase subunit C